MVWSWRLAEQTKAGTLHLSFVIPSDGGTTQGELPNTAKASTEIVRVRRIDDYMDKLTVSDNILVKLYVQGYEDKVIAGGKRLLQRAKILIVQTAMVPLYDRQAFFRDIFTTLDSDGFKAYGALNPPMSLSDRSVLFADSIFVRKA
jgi:hypothetical protein